jgi:hypothetical protein
MSHITVLLVDGPGDGQKFALQDDRHTVEVFSADNQTTFRYQTHRFILDGQTYMIGALDPRKADGHEVPEKIRAAKLDPLPGA